MFINFSNHPHGKWGEAQAQAAKSLGNGEIVSVPFPNVPPSATSGEVSEMAHEVVEKILGHKPDVVMAQGEFSLTHKVTRLLQDHDVEVVVACSERVSKEIVQNDGSTKKVATFEFVQFRSV